MCFFQRRNNVFFGYKVALAYFVVQSSQRLMNFVRVVQVSCPSMVELLPPFIFVKSSPRTIKNKYDSCAKGSLPAKWIRTLLSERIFPFFYAAFILRKIF